MLILVRQNLIFMKAPGQSDFALTKPRYLGLGGAGRGGLKAETNWPKVPLIARDILRDIAIIISIRRKLEVG